MRMAPIIGMVCTILPGFVIGCFYWFFLIYRLFDKNSKLCIVEEGADTPTFYEGDVPTDLQTATNVSKVLYINMLGIAVVGIFFLFFFICVAIKKMDHQALLFGIGLTSITYCTWVSFALPFQILYWYSEPIGVCAGGSAHLQLY